MINVWLGYRKCPTCKKEFAPNPDEWAYVRDKKKFCSWHCLREYDRRKEEKKRISRK